MEHPNTHVNTITKPPPPLFWNNAKTVSESLGGARDVDYAGEGAVSSEAASGMSVIEQVLRCGVLASAEECRSYLCCFPRGEAILTHTQQKVAHFLRSYVIVPGYHKHTSRKVAELIDATKSELRRAWMLHCAEQAIEPGWSQRSFPIRQVGLAAESCVMEHLHDRVFASLSAWTHKQDGELHRVMQTLSNGMGGASLGRLSTQALHICGVPERIRSVDLSLAAATLLKIQTDCKCPLEMMTCLLAANNAIIDAISAALHSLSVQVSADELLPLFISALALASLPNISSVLQYMMTFHSEGDLQGQSGYQLAMLEAAVEFFSQCHRKGFVSKGVDTRVPREWCQASPERNSKVDLLPVHQVELDRPDNLNCSFLASKLLSGLMMQGEAGVGSLTHYRGGERVKESSIGEEVRETLDDVLATGLRGLGGEPNSGEKSSGVLDAAQEEASRGNGVEGPCGSAQLGERSESYSLTDWHRAFQVTSDLQTPASDMSATTPSTPSLFPPRSSASRPDFRAPHACSPGNNTDFSPGVRAAAGDGGGATQRPPAVISAASVASPTLGTGTGTGLGSFLENLRMSRGRTSFSSTM